MDPVIVFLVFVVVLILIALVSLAALALVFLYLLGHIFPPQKAPPASGDGDAQGTGT